MLFGGTHRLTISGISIDCELVPRENALAGAKWFFPKYPNWWSRSAEMSHAWFVTKDMVSWHRAAEADYQKLFVAAEGLNESVEKLRVELEEAKRKLDTVISERDVESVKLEEMTNRRDELRLRCLDLRNQMDADFAATKDEISRLKERLATQTEKVSHLTLGRTEAENRAKVYLGQIDTLASDLDAKDSQFAKLADQLDLERRPNGILEAEVSSLRVREEEISLLKNRVSELEADKVAIVAINDALEDEKSLLVSRVNELNDECNRFSDENASRRRVIDQIERALGGS